MSEPSDELTRLQHLIREIAREVGLHEVCTAARSVKDDGSLVTDTDLRMQESLQQHLSREWPDNDILGEEMEFEEQARAIKEIEKGVFCIDPVDGTTNYANGFPFFGVSVGLVDTAGSRLGVVYDPARDELFAAEREAGAWCNGTALHTRMDVSLRSATACVDYKRLYRRLSERLVQSPPFGPTRHLGSSTLEWCWLARGRFHLYLHGGQKLWDYAAGALILKEAGGVARTLDGSELKCNTLTKRSIVAASDAELFADWNAWINENMQSQNRRV